MQTYTSLALLAIYAAASFVFALAWNRIMPRFNPNMDMGRRPFNTYGGGQVDSENGALGIASTSTSLLMQSVTPGAAISIAAFFAAPIAFMLGTVQVPSWFFGVPEVTIFHKALLYIIGLCWAWVALRSLAMAAYLLVSGKFILVGLVALPIWYGGAILQRGFVSDTQKFNACTLQQALTPSLTSFKDVGAQCTPPPQTPVGIDVSGTWTGDYSCSGLTYNVKLVLITEKNGNVSGRSVISGSDKPAIFQISGTARGSHVKLVADKWIEGPRGVPVLNVSAFHSHTENRRLLGTKMPRNCSDFDVTKMSPEKVKEAQDQKAAYAIHLKKITELAAGMPATKSTKASKALPGLRGTWVGFQSCIRQGAEEKIRIRLLLSSNAAGHIDGVLIFHPDPFKLSEVPYGSYRVSGEINGTNVSLRAGSWIVHPPGYMASDLNLSLHTAMLASMRGPIRLKENDSASSPAIGTVRKMLGMEKLKDGCGDVRLDDEVESF